MAIATFAEDDPLSNRLFPELSFDDMINYDAYTSETPRFDGFVKSFSSVGDSNAQHQANVWSSGTSTGIIQQYVNPRDLHHAALPPAPPPSRPLQTQDSWRATSLRDDECRRLYQQLDTCRRCFSSRANHDPVLYRLPLQDLPIAGSFLANTGKRNEVRPQTPAMEATVAAPAHEAAPPPTLPSSPPAPPPPPVEANNPPAVPTSPQHHEDPSLITMPPQPTQTPAKEQAATTNGSNHSWPDTPAHITDHGTLSNVRGAAGQDILSFHNDLLNDLAVPSSATDIAAGQDSGLPDDEAEPGTPPNEQVPAEDDFAEHEAYAMLRFPDSHALITSRNLVITRDEVYFRRWRHQRTEERKQRKKAQQDLISYSKEPSRKSEDGLDHDPSSRSGDGEQLEGRPARGLLSNFSEQGGPVAYAPSDDEEYEEYEASRARRRQRRNNNNSSTSNSIAPADLHMFQSGALDAGEQMGVNNYVTEDGTEYDPREWAALPVHTANPDDITRISREHLIFSYDGLNERWVLHVVGNGAVVNGVPYMKGTRDIELHHDDEIFISTVAMRFALPAGLDRSTDADESVDAVLESVEAASDLDTSPVRRLSHAFGADYSEDEDDDDEEAAPEPEQARTPKRPKLVKLKLKGPKPKSQKKPAAKDEPLKGNGKGKSHSQQKDKAKAKDKSDSKDEAKDGAKKPEKGKKPKTAAPETTPAIKSEAEKPIGSTAPEDATQAKATQASPPVAPLNLDPGSVLAGLEPEQMPEKRKGPGRPPKNGVLSKRDESGVKRKRKEYERQGLEPPELNVLLQEVRAEQRQKDAMNKALARGEPAPDMAIPSVEAEAKVDGEGGSHSAHRESHGLDGESSALGERRASSPKLPRRPKSPSPIPPESSFSEEDLKKPNMTYIYIINEILESIEGGQADLQTIYDKIQKRWPYYKYRVNSVGWQSSVRHNLLSCERFKEAGKSGKGKMWTINTEHPLDNKKRKNSPPPRQPQVATNGYQYGQPGYGQYNQPQYNPSGPYASPYGSGQVPHNGHYPQHQQTGAPRPPSQQPRQEDYGALNGIVQDILAFKNAWVDIHKHDPTKHASLSQLFDRGTTYFSDIYHKSGQDPGPPVNAEEEPFKTLKAIFEKHNDIFNKASAAAPAAAASNPHDTASNSNGATSSAPAPQQNQPGTSSGPPNPAVGLGTPQYPGPSSSQSIANSSHAAGFHANGTVSSTAIQQAGPAVHGHASVQQQVNNAIANQERAAVAQQAPRLQNVPPPSSGSFATQMPSAGTFQSQAPQHTFQQHTFATSATAPAANTTVSATPPVGAAIGGTNGQTVPAPSTPHPPGNAIDLTSSASHAPPQPPIDHNTSGPAPSYGTPKAPTPEALSRPPSAGNGAKRAAEDETRPASEEEHEAKRQRTS